ncbi:MAG: hypothetical protein ACI8RD_005588 [Bacillariaceae sp.]|jgi:hypothetical protein
MLLLQYNQKQFVQSFAFVLKHGVTIYFSIIVIMCVCVDQKLNTNLKRYHTESNFMLNNLTFIYENRIIVYELS